MSLESLLVYNRSVALFVNFMMLYFDAIAASVKISLIYNIN